MPLPPRVADLTPSITELGSMSRAATAHGVSQAAVSARVRSLEGALGITVLERSPRGTRLTPEGALVADWAGAVVDAARTLEEVSRPCGPPGTRACASPRASPSPSTCSPAG